MERRSVFSERSNAAQYANSDDEEDGYDSPNVKRRGASVDDFLKGSELGKQVSSLVFFLCQLSGMKQVFLWSSAGYSEYQLIIVVILVKLWVGRRMSSYWSIMLFYGNWMLSTMYLYVVIPSSGLKHWKQKKMEQKCDSNVTFGLWASSVSCITLAYESILWGKKKGRGKDFCVT